MDLSVTFCDIKLKNPLIAGSADNSRSLSQFRKLAEAGLSAVVLKSLTDVEALQNRNMARFRCLNGNLRAWKTGEDKGAFYSRGGSMLSVGEWKASLAEIEPIAADHGVALIGNICASRQENWRAFALMIEDAGLPAIELNLGNPHYGASDKPLGARIAQSEELLADIIGTACSSVSIPVIAKLSPQVSDIVRLSKIAAAAGAAALTIAHRFQGFMIDIENREPISKHLYGYGGPWLVPIALGYVYKIASEFSIPVCGSGGVRRWEDVMQFIMAGASTVQMTSSLMLETPEIVPDILFGIREFLKKHDDQCLQNLVGSALGKAGCDDRMPDEARLFVRDPSACRQCARKPCIDACFFDAVTRTSDGAVEISNTCTACGLCRQFCPFEDVLEFSTAPSEEGRKLK